MADINGVSFTSSGSPTITYTIAYSVTSDNGYKFTITSQMGYSSSYFGTGYSLTATVKVGDYSQTIALKSTSESWSGTTAHTATGTLYCGLSSSARTVTFSVSRESGGGTTGVVAANSSYTIKANQSYTQVSAPTAMSFSPTSNFENSLKVSWSGAEAGTNNAITGYWLVPQFSTDNATWTAGTIIEISSTSTSGSYTIDTSDWDYGIYVYFKMRTLGTQTIDGQKYSTTAYSSTTTRKIVVSDPTPPWISIDATQGTIQEIVTVSWGAGTAGTNNSISGYSLRIYHSSSATSGYSEANTLTFDSDMRSATLTLSDYVTRGRYVKFNIGVIGSHDGTITYSPLESSYVKANYQPSAPTKIWPASSRTSYNTTPYVKLRGGTDGDSDNQDYYITFDTAGMDSSYNIGYRGYYIVQVAGNNTIIARTKDSCDCSSNLLSFSVSVIDTPWGRGKRLSKGDAVTASDMTDLRTAVNNVRQYYSLGTIVWSNIVAGETVVQASHITDLQSALDDAIAVQGRTSVTWNKVAAGNKIKADDINQIREVIEKL